MSTQENQYDVIIIGSGFGGLTTGSLLAQIGKKRVLVVEKHFKLGGFTHSFRRKDYNWDVGVHYMGEMHEGSMPRKIMDLITRKGVQWHRMNSPIERIMFPEGSIDYPDDPKLFCKQLCERFPEDAHLIPQYFKDVWRMKKWIKRWFISKIFGPKFSDFLTYFGRAQATQITSEYLSRFINPLLRATLAAQWPDFGTPPHESAFGYHSAITTHFFNGAFYPVGGSTELAKHASQAIIDFGGKCLVSTEVKSIDVKDGEACGITVVSKNKEMKYYAPIVISNAGAKTTFEKLVPEDYCQAEREQAARLKPGTSALVLFLGLNDDPRKHGFSDCNYWMFRDTTHDTNARIREGQPLRMDGGFISFGSLRNPGQEPHTAQVITVSEEKTFEAFKDKPWMNRGEEYEACKEQLAEQMLDFVEQFLPGVRKLVEYKELSTPLTVKSFTGHPFGQIYGQACDPNRLTRDQWRVATSLKNLYLTGSDVGGPGVHAAMFAGVMTAGKILGGFAGLGRVMRKAYGF